MHKNDHNRRLAVFLAKIMAPQYPELDRMTILEHAQASVCELHEGLCQESKLQSSGAFTKDLTLLYRVDLL